MSRSQLQNYINGQWQCSEATENLDVTDPATAQRISSVPLSPKKEVNAAVDIARDAFLAWRTTPVTERVQCLYKLKILLEERRDDFARVITAECGKTLAEGIGEMQRGIENVEVACGMPSLMQGYNSEDIARGIDEHMIRQPLGVVAAITPFNFPGMIPLWFLPYAVATGNCFILKPSEKVPMTSQKLFEAIHEAGFPPGVVQLVNGDKAVVDAILEHTDIKAVSFVGSTPVAKYVYSKASAAGKRAQCQGGAKNPVVIMPDADLETTTKIMADSAFGCAGQRCLAASLAITVGSSHEPFLQQMIDVATSRQVGHGLTEGAQMGPVITEDSKNRIERLVGEGVAQGAKIVVDGRGKKVDGYERGYFVHPTLLDEVNPTNELAQTEVFGPVLSIMRADTVEDAITLVNQREFGNMACIFTSSGATARQFRYAADAGNVGINIGVAAPMAFFPFSGWNESFFGDLHAQGRHGVEFYTQTKVVVERWPNAWSRKF